MATVLVGGYGSDPSTIWPEKYKSCFWNFITGWQCETADPLPPAAPPPAAPPLGSTPDPNNPPSMLPVLSTGGGFASGCGCCSGAVPTSAPVASSGAVVAESGAVVVAKNCGDCGYTNREALLALAVALAFFLLLGSD